MSECWRNRLTFVAANQPGAEQQSVKGAIGTCYTIPRSPAVPPGFLTATEASLEHQGILQRTPP